MAHAADCATVLALLKVNFLRKDWVQETQVILQTSFSLSFCDKHFDFFGQCKVIFSYCLFQKHASTLMFKSDLTLAFFATDNHLCLTLRILISEFEKSSFAFSDW